MTRIVIPEQKEKQNKLKWSYCRRLKVICELDSAAGNGFLTRQYRVISNRCDHLSTITFDWLIALG